MGDEKNVLVALFDPLLKRQFCCREMEIKGFLINKVLEAIPLSSYMVHLLFITYPIR